jgi:hypothetical protein
MRLVGIITRILVLSLVRSEPQFIQIYEIDLSDNQVTRAPYQNNPFLSSLNANQQDTSILPAISSCDSYWSYQNNFFEQWGQIKIPEPHYMKNVIRITLSLAARLNTVRKLRRRLYLENLQLYKNMETKNPHSRIMMCL